MQRLILLVSFLFTTFLQPALSQNTFKAKLIDSTSKEKIFGAAVAVDETSIGGFTDTNGYVILQNIPDGKQQIIVSALGYERFKLNLVFPLKKPDTIFRLGLAKNEDDDDLAAVTVSSTRTNSRIEDLPLKIEVIGSEDVNEETAINPANITGLLTDLAGVHVQQTSLSSGNETPKLLGLDGKYVQVLRDGLPLYEGFSGGFGMLQLPPMDIKQIEVIKGSASTLYGGGAIAGIINIISKAPQTKPELSVTLNGTTAKEGDANVYYSQRFNKFGITLFAGNTTQEYDAVNGFTIIPQLQSNTLHPVFYFYPDNKTTLSLGLSSTYETRTGGNAAAIANPVHGDSLYYELNNTFRNTADLHFERTLDNKDVFSIKGSISNYRRDWQTNYYIFDANQLSEYGEISYLIPRDKNNLVFGLNYTGEVFTRLQTDSSSNINNFSKNTFGAFAQDDWKLTSQFTLEGGLREDLQNNYGTFFLPHLAALWQVIPSLSFRLGGGFGYETPDILSYDLTSDDEKDYFKRVLAISSSVTPEKSAGGNFDINFKHLFDEITLSGTQSFFYTQINSPIILNEDPTAQTYSFGNGNAPFVTQGSETYLSLREEDEWEIYAGYTYDFTQRKYYQAQPVNPLTPKNDFATDIACKVLGKWRVAVEVSYTDMQYLENNSTVPGYWDFAAMLQWKSKKICITLNCENLSNIKETNFWSMVIGPTNNPGFRPEWEPLAGRILNLAVQFKL